MSKYKIEIKWAVIFAVVGLLWMALERALGWHDEHIDKHAVYTNFFAIPAIAMFVFALLDKRKNYYGGTMTYKQGFMTGLIITLIITILSPLTQYVTIAFIAPHYFENAINHAVSSGEMTREDAEKTFSISSYMVLAPVGALVMGIITSAVVALFTKKKAES